MPKILITGASGFVGSFLVEEALKRGLETFAGIRTSSSKKWLQDKRINIVELDLSDRDQLSAQIDENQFDYIIHNAGITKSNNKNDFYKVNVDYSLNLALSSRASSNLKKFSFISSLAAYGPADFQKDGVLSNESVPHPVTTYGKSKLEAERVLKEISDFPLLIFRPTGVFGPRESDFLTIFKTINRGFAPQIGSTEQWISLVYVKDLAHVIIKATTSDISNRQYFVSDGNLYPGSKFNKTIAESLGKNPLRFKIPLSFVYVLAGVNEAVSKLTGKPGILDRDKFAEIKAQNLDCDISDLVRDFNFKPKYNLATAISETAEWYKANNWI